MPVAVPNLLLHRLALAEAPWESVLPSEGRDSQFRACFTWNRRYRQIWVFRGIDVEQWRLDYGRESRFACVGVGRLGFRLGEPGRLFFPIERMQEFVVDAARAAKLRRASKLGVEQFLRTLVKPTAELARAPISKFHVGAVGLGVSGRIFRGVNLEFPKLPLNHSVHAEQFLVANALQHGEKKLVFVAVSSAPCGHCRQFLQELRDAGDIRILVTDGKDAQVRPLSYFLPHRFGPDDLLHKSFPLLLEPRSNGLVGNGDGPNLHGSVESAAKITRAPKPADFMKEASLRSWMRADNPYLGDLKSAAFEAANASYAPYSRSPSGLSLVTREGAIFSGSYMESAAYNPGLPALQAALVAFICGGGGDYDEIEAVVLVEVRGASVRYAPTVRLALQSIAPLASFQHFDAQSDAQSDARPRETSDRTL